jgi:tellurite resistance protein TerC
MTIGVIQWSILLTLILGLFIFDLFVSGKGAREFTVGLASRWIAFYVAIAIAFAVWIYIGWGSEFATQFVAGYVTEYSLSIDNLFVFLVILNSFRVPRESWHRVLLIGITISLLLRAVLIFLGTALIERFIGTFIVFGLFLLWTAWHVGSEKDPEEESEGRVIRLVRKIVPVTTDFHEHRLTLHIDGRRHLTPLALVMVSISTANVVFALDSIPAILGLTQESFIVIAANAFALMGLRQLFFMVLGLLDRLIYLARGLSLVLAFIGAKLILEAVHELWWNDGPTISTGTSLLVSVAVLGTTAIASLSVERKRKN